MSRRTTTPIGMANASAVSGRVIAHQPTQNATSSSHRRSRDSRQLSSDHHAPRMVIVVVTSE